VLTKYLTLGNLKEVKINIMKSEFIVNGMEVNDHQQGMDFLATIKEKYPDANHHCWAYIIDVNKVYDDNGEPCGTAGSPILNVLKRNDLNNTMIIVTRYFGGKKLGVSGLIAAYRKAAEKLVENSTIIERRLGYIFCINCDYNYANKIISRKDHRIKVLAQKYTDEVSMEIFVEFEATLIYESDFSDNNIKVNSRIESVN
jgi:uncharacterized YigZ family protein